MISSTAGLISFYGYSSYAPSKHALRSLADCLRDELEVASRGSTTIHIYFVSTINSEGFLEEQKTKPEITMKIEGSESSDSSPESRAISLLKGIEKGQFHITSDFITDIFRVSMTGISRSNNFFLDTILLLIGWIVIGIWKFYVDKIVILKR